MRSSGNVETGSVSLEWERPWGSQYVNSSVLIYVVTWASYLRHWHCWSWTNLWHLLGSSGLESLAGRVHERESSGTALGWGSCPTLVS